MLMFVFRAAFWLVVLTLFLPPQYRPLPFVEFKLPERLGDGGEARREISIPDNHYCQENKDFCVDVADALDTVTVVGLVGLGYVKTAVEAGGLTEMADDDDDKSMLGRLIDG
jgi:hypothetical protein